LEKTSKNEKQATKQLSGSPVTNARPNGDAVRGSPKKKGVGQSVQPWGLLRTNAWLSRMEQRTIAPQTGKLHGTIPLYLRETDSGFVV
jgi:hypothetical protein